ncbi:MAG: hypothetical protein WC437_02030 [Patescibacteria group bacterium]|jgi:arginine utilization protein RocB|nr:hypothetical protein [Patescibacteria group bacterium]
MKKRIPINKITDLVKKHKDLFIGVLLCVFFAGMAYASYLAINPSSNVDAVKKGEEQLQNLNINIDEKTIKELKDEKAPTVINGAAGRNPFTPL